MGSAVFADMNKCNYPFRRGIPVCVALLLTLALGACSDSREERQTNAGAPQSQAQPVFDHPHGAEVSDLVKHKFEHDFAEQCVDREIKAAGNQEQYRDELAKSCMCIAQDLMKNLTAKEAELFLQEHKNTQSLRIRYEAAAYKCVQTKTHLQHSQAPEVVNPQP